MKALFPTRFGGAEQPTQLWGEQQQRRAVALARWVATGQARYRQELDLLDAWLLDQARPDIYDDEDERNVLTRHRRQFGATCAALAAQGFPRAQELPLAEFHAAIEYLLEKNQPE